MESAIEKILGNNGIKILRILYNSKEFTTIPEICKEGEFTDTIARKYLQAFRNQGIIEEIHIGRVVAYRINKDNAKSKAILNLFELWESS